MKYKWHTFLTFTLPSFAAFVFIVVVPFITGLTSSFTNWEHLSQSKGNNFVGIDNYKKAFEDKLFLNAFLYTISYTVLAIVLINVLGFSLALLLHKSFRGRNIFRSSFFLPNLIGGIIIGFIWQVLFTKGFESLGISKWLSTKTNTFLAMEVVTAWQYSGYVMIIFAAALQNIPQDQIEAAKISGSSKLRIFRKVIIPNLMSAFTVTLFIALSRSVKVFALTVSLTNGGINDSVTVSYDIYQTAWQQNFLDLPGYLGIAQAKAIIFTVFVSALAIVQVRFTKKREIVS